MMLNDIAISEAIYETISSVKKVDKDEGTLIDIFNEEKPQVQVQIEKVIKENQDSEGLIQFGPYSHMIFLLRKKDFAIRKKIL